MAAAERTWSGTGFGGKRAESADTAFSLCFGRTNPLDGEFQALANRIYGPVRAVAQEEGR
jgi:hypothetical protein